MSDKNKRKHGINDSQLGESLIESPNRSPENKRESYPLDRDKIEEYSDEEDYSANLNDNLLKLRKKSFAADF